MARIGNIELIKQSESDTRVTGIIIISNLEVGYVEFDLINNIASMMNVKVEEKYRKLFEREAKLSIKLLVEESYITLDGGYLAHLFMTLIILSKLECLYHDLKEEYGLDYFLQIRYCDNNISIVPASNKEVLEKIAEILEEQTEIETIELLCEELFSVSDCDERKMWN